MSEQGVVLQDSTVAALEAALGSLGNSGDPQIMGHLFREASDALAEDRRLSRASQPAPAEPAGAAEPSAPSAATIRTLAAKGTDTHLGHLQEANAPSRAPWLPEKSSRRCETCEAYSVETRVCATPPVDATNIRLRDPEDGTCCSNFNPRPSPPPAAPDGECPCRDHCHTCNPLGREGHLPKCIPGPLCDTIRALAAECEDLRQQVCKLAPKPTRKTIPLGPPAEWLAPEPEEGSDE